MPIFSGSLKPDEASVAAAPLADTVKINTKIESQIKDVISFPLLFHPDFVRPLSC